jgi:hypothetical protein
LSIMESAVSLLGKKKKKTIIDIQEN